MAKARKITQNINKDAGLLDLPKVKVDNSKWLTKSSNYLTCNIGDIVPIFCDEVLPNEKRSMKMGQLSHMGTPIAPIFNAQYTEFRSFFVPFRLAADLLNGYSTRKSPFVKVFGEDNVSTNANIIVPLAQQKLPSHSSGNNDDIFNDYKNNFSSFGGVCDALDIETTNVDMFKDFNFLNLASYELIYQYHYRNQNRVSATNSPLYKWLFGLYSRTTKGNISFLGCDKFHQAQREKDYFTGAAPFTQKGDPVSVGLVGDAPVYGFATADNQQPFQGFDTSDEGQPANRYIFEDNSGYQVDLKAILSEASGVNIEQLRISIKLQEQLEKDAMYGSEYSDYLNAHFGCAPMSLVLDKPLELKKVTITSQMQPIFQTSQTSGESTILGTIGANATTQSGEFEIVPETKFLEHGYLIICAVHKAQNSYDATYFKPKHIFKKARFDFYTPELNDLGYQTVAQKEIDASSAIVSLDEPAAFNEAWAEYRYKFNKVHGMFEPSRPNALSYWTLAMSGYTDIQSLYIQEKTELDRALSVNSSNAPQFFDAYGFIEINDKPMSLHSIPGMDGVI